MWQSTIEIHMYNIHMHAIWVPEYVSHMGIPYWFHIGNTYIVDIWDPYGNTILQAAIRSPIRRRLRFELSTNCAAYKRF